MARARRGARNDVQTVWREHLQNTKKSDVSAKPRRAVIAVGERHELFRVRRGSCERHGGAWV